MSQRVEALMQLQREIDQKGAIYLRNGGGSEARRQVVTSRAQFEKDNFALLKHELATQYIVNPNR